MAKIVGIWVKKFKKSYNKSVWIMILMVEIDSALWKSSWTPKMLKFDSCKVYLQKSLPNFFQILS